MKRVFKKDNFNFMAIKILEQIRLTSSVITFKKAYKVIRFLFRNYLGIFEIGFSGELPLNLE